MDIGQRDPLEVLANDFLARQRLGECPTVDEYAARYPDLAAKIRDFLPTVAMIEQIKVRKNQSGDGRATLCGAELKQLDDFRILGEIGRGGMGIVYLAKQESLARQVAIKVLPRQSLLNPKQLERFEREAQTAANLHHTNIVPVFGVGVCDGFHYIAMQHIDGVSLAEVIDQMRQLSQRDNAQLAQPSRKQQLARTIAAGLADDSFQRTPGRNPAAYSGQGNNGSAEEPAPSAPIWLGPRYWHAAARVTLQVARALQHAHSMGTLHRDIKPGNLLLDSCGNTWITDFGLAKAMEHDSVSATGDVVGTVAYMAPESFEREADVRSDLYSLGLTLHEMLVLRPAFDATNRRDMMRQVTQSEPTRPRACNPEIPLDLETIALKAICREPHGRYQTAGDLADDLDRFLSDRPIRARRATKSELAWRWCRRNPAVAALSALAVALLVLVAAVASMGFARQSEQRSKAEASLAVSLEALEKVYNQLAPNDIGNSAPPIEVSPETVALLEDLLEFYDRFAEQGGSSSNLLAERAKARRRVGDLHLRLGHAAPAEAAYCQAIDEYEQLVSMGSDWQFDLELARVHAELGNVYARLGLFPPAHSTYYRGLHMLEKLPERSNGAEVRYERARLHYLLGKKPDHPPVSPREDGVSVKSPPPHGPPPHRPPRHGPWPHGPPPDGPPRGPPPRPLDLLRHHAPILADSLADPESRSQHFARLQRRLSPRLHISQAIELMVELTAKYPDRDEFQYLLALSYREHARDFRSKRVRTAIASLERLCREFPDNTAYRYALYETYALIKPFTNLPVEGLLAAEERLRKALAGFAELNVDVNLYRAGGIKTKYKLGSVLVGLAAAGVDDKRLVRVQEAEELLRAALQTQQPLIEAAPQAPANRLWTAAIEKSLAEALRAQRKWPEARAMLEKSLGRTTRLSTEDRNAWYVNVLLIDTLEVYSDVLTRLRESDLSQMVDVQLEEYKHRLPTRHRHMGRPPRDSAPPDDSELTRSRRRPR